MKTIIFKIIFTLSFLFAALAHAQTPRNMVHWFEDGPFVNSMTSDQWIAQSGFALADDGTLWALLLDPRTDTEDPNSPLWSPTCSLYNATQRASAYSWVAYSTVSVSGGRKIVTYYPLVGSGVIIGRAIMDDGTLWTLVNTDTQCSCENICSNYGAFTDSGFAWYQATPALPAIP